MKAEDVKKIKFYAKEQPGPGKVTIIDADGNEEPLRHIVRHSPDGFNWGYGGSGPADLALSICTLFDEPDLYQLFKWKVIAGIPLGQDYELSVEEIKKVLAESKKKWQEYMKSGPPRLSCHER